MKDLEYLVQTYTSGIRFLIAHLRGLTPDGFPFVWGDHIMAVATSSDLSRIRDLTEVARTWILHETVLHIVLAAGAVTTFAQYGKHGKRLMSLLMLVVGVYISAYTAHNAVVRHLILTAGHDLDIRLHTLVFVIVRVLDVAMFIIGIIWWIVTPTRIDRMQDLHDQRTAHDCEAYNDRHHLHTSIEEQQVAIQKQHALMEEQQVAIQELREQLHDRQREQTDMRIELHIGQREQTEMRIELHNRQQIAMREFSEHCEAKRQHTIADTTEKEHVTPVSQVQGDRTTSRANRQVMTRGFAKYHGVRRKTVRKIVVRPSARPVKR